MADLSTSERLTPLDLLMPPTYIRVLLTFRTTDSSTPIFENLNDALDRVSETVPWLSGHVFATPTATEQTPGLEIRYHPAPGRMLVDKGMIDVPYETLSAEGLLFDMIPDNVWPTPPMIDQGLFLKGAPVFGASFFRFEDGQGVGLCISMHHSAVDAAGFADIVRLWAQHNAGLEPSYTVCDSDRSARLLDILQPDLQKISSTTTDSLFASHPEYSKIPPAFPTEFPSCTCKHFMLSVAHLNTYKERLQGYVSGTMSTNALVCALIWSAITRARMQRSPALAHESSRLAMAVNGRRRLGVEFSPPKNPYLGNTILYSLARLSASDLDSRLGSLESLAKICDAIGQSQSPTKIDSSHIAEVYSLVERAEDYRSIFVGWDLFSSRDLTITSWADLDFYAMEFGKGLGRPEFTRVASSAADGVGIILPRKGASAGTSEVVEIMIMLRSDDMSVLEEDAVWKDFSP
ncbi:transferase family-domain-containing protein [Xylaria grammica]|nr:transferase family-domain-containing protein [Xylaria grammica]